MEMWTIIKWIIAVFLILVLSVVVKMGYDKAVSTSSTLSNPYCEETGYDLEQFSKLFAERSIGYHENAIKLYDLHSNCFEIKDIKLSDEEKNKIFCELEGDGPHAMMLAHKYEISKKTREKINSYCNWG